jgi:RND family efflux transporter MFP subunit
MKRRERSITGIIWKSTIIFPLLVLISAGCGTNSEKNELAETIRVRTAKIKTRELSIPVRANGILSSKAEMRLSFITAGIISRITAEEGDYVRRGSLLAELDLSEINARVMQAKSAFTKAKRDFQRVKILYSDSAATLEQFQDVTTGYEVAKSNMRIAEFNLKHSRIEAPADGRILKKFVEANELIGSGSPVFVFGSEGEGSVLKVGISDRDIIKFQKGDSAAVFFDAYPGREFSALITGIARSADPATGTFEIEIFLGTQKEKLMSGFTAKARLFPSMKSTLRTIPLKALVDADGTKGFVFVPVDSGKSVRRIEVQTGVITGNMVAVTGDFGSFTEVVTDGAPYLSDQSNIEVIR